MPSRRSPLFNRCLKFVMVIGIGRLRRLIKSIIIRLKKMLPNLHEERGITGKALGQALVTFNCPLDTFVRRFRVMMTPFL